MASASASAYDLAHYRTSALGKQGSARVDRASLLCLVQSLAVRKLTNETH